MARRKPEFKYEVVVEILSGITDKPVHLDGIFVHAYNGEEALAKGEQYVRESEYWDERIQPSYRGKCQRVD